MHLGGRLPLLVGSCLRRLMFVTGRRASGGAIRFEGRIGCCPEPVTGAGRRTLPESPPAPGVPPTPLRSPMILKGVVVGLALAFLFMLAMFVTGGKLF